MKCANCNNDAQYVYRLTDSLGTPYCDKDLPRFLLERKTSGALETTAAFEEALNTAMTSLKTTSSAKKRTLIPNE